MTWKISPLLNFEISGVFVKALAADENYAFGDSGDLQFRIQMPLSQKRKTFSELFVAFMESPWNFKLLTTKMILIANVFPKWQTVKRLVKPLSRKRRFRTSFDSQRVNGCQTLESIFIIFLEHSEEKWLEKYLPYGNLKS